MTKKDTNKLKVSREIKFVIATLVALSLVGIIAISAYLKISDDQNSTKSYIKKYDNGVISFWYPSRYILQENECEAEGCISNLSLQTDTSEYFSGKINVNVWKDASYLKIVGQVSVLTYSEGKFVKQTSSEHGIVTAELEQLESSQEGLNIYRGENGGSMALYEYYIIEDKETSRIAVISFPREYRIQCSEPKCEDWLKEIKAEDEGWLPDQYLDELFFEKEGIVESVRFTKT